MFPLGYELPEALDILVHPTLTPQQFSAELHQFAFLCGTGNYCRFVCFALLGTLRLWISESKFTEAALGGTDGRLSKLRAWASSLAREGGAHHSACFVTDDDRNMADKTLQLIPSDIPSSKDKHPPERIHREPYRTGHSAVYCWSCRRSTGD